MPHSVPSALDGSRSAHVQELAETEVVRRAQLGSSAAFGELVRRRGPDLHRYLAVRLRNENDAWDAFQETLTAAWTSLPKLASADKFWPWLLTIATRTSHALARTRSRSTGDGLDLLEHREEQALEIWDAVGRLPPHQRDVLVLRYRLGLSEKETAEVLGVRVGIVKSRAFAARRSLRELLG